MIIAYFQCVFQKFISLFRNFCFARSCIILKAILKSSIIATKIDKIDIKDVSIQVPLNPIRNIMCIGKNYKDHIGEIQNVISSKASKDTDTEKSVPGTPDIPKFPVFFSKATTSVIGHSKMIESHSKLTKFLDYEGKV